MSDDTKPPKRRNARSILAEIANDRAAPATARVAAAKALLRKPRKPAEPPKAPDPVSDGLDAVTRRALELAAERRRLN